MSHKQKIFNYRLSRARRYIECTFGILSNKFRVFHTPINANFSIAKTIVKASCILHNFIRVRDGYNGNELLSVSGLIDMNLQPTSRTGNTLRELFADYFISPAGSVSWQDRQIF